MAQETDRNRKQIPVGVPLVVFDPTGAIRDGRSQRIWCSVWGEGIFLTEDGGRTWRKVHDRPDITELVVAKDGSVYATAGNHKDATTAHVKPDFLTLRFRDGKWKDITPAGCNRCGDIAVSLQDEDFLFVFAGGGAPFRSYDGGDTWQRLEMERVADDIPWLGWTDESWFSLAEVIFDPTDPDRLWCCNGIGVWTANAREDKRLVWHSVTAGIEDLVAKHVIKAPGGPIVCAVMDRSIFVVRNPDQYAERHHPDRRFRGGRRSDFCARLPSNWAAVSTGQVMISRDSGENWKFTSAQPGGSRSRVGAVAVAASDPNAMVAIADNHRMYYTTDGGATWRESSVPGRPAGSETLEADRVAPKTFYWYDGGLGLLVSADGGATWQVRTRPEALPARQVNQLATDFRRAGHLLVCWGSLGNGGVSHSIDGRRHWQQLKGFDDGWGCAIGKEREVDGPSTLYVRGTRNGSAGIWRSTDDGTTWEKIVVHPRGIFHKGSHLWADWESFGVVYIALRGNGFAFGRPRD